MDEQERDLIEMTDDEGNTIMMEVIDYFFYNGDEFVILTDSIPENGEEEDVEDVNCYVMKVVTSTDENGEEFEEFEPIEDPDLEARVMAVAEQTLSADEEADE